MKLPYEWERDIEERVNGANIHDIYGFKGLLSRWLYLIETAKERGEKAKYDYRVKRLNESLVDGYERGLLSYRYTFKEN